MTSFSTTESAASRAELFSLPADQMSHIQIYTVVQAPLERTLRLSGAVAYNGYHDHSGDHASGRAGEPHRGHARRARDRGPAAAVRRQPRLFANALRLHQGARRLPAGRQILQARPGSLRAPSHRPGRSRTGRIESHASGSGPAIERAGHSRSGNSESRKRSDGASGRGVAAAGAAGGRNCGTALLAGATAAGRRNAVLHAFGYEQRVGASQRIPERYCLCACRRRGNDRQRNLSRRGARQDSVCRARARSNHADAAGAHRSLQSRRALEKETCMSRRRFTPG